MIAMLSMGATLAATTVGVELAGHTDLGDATQATTGFSGLSFGVPVRISVSDAARVRLTPRFDFGGGRDQVSWASGEAVNGETFRYYADSHQANMQAIELMAAAEVDLVHSGSVRPFLSAGLGVGAVSHHHAFGGADSPETVPLLLPADAGGATQDPRTQQLAWLSELRVGARMEMSEGLALGAHIGYSTAFLGARTLKDTAPEFEARRDAYGWNALRVGLAAHFAL